MPMTFVTLRSPFSLLVSVVVIGSVVVVESSSKDVSQSVSDPSQSVADASQSVSDPSQSVTDPSLADFLDSCLSPPSLCYYLLLVPSLVVIFTALCCSKWVGYMFFKHN